jgi:hypothetical protein
MKWIVLALLGMAAISTAAEKPLLAVFTDIGGDPDERQSMIRLMVYANEFEIEALVTSAAGTPGELKESITQPELIREIIAAHGKVLPHLRKHADGWPAAEHLPGVVKSGNPHRGRKHIGKGHDTAGSRFLIERIEAGTGERPRIAILVLVEGGTMREAGIRCGLKDSAAMNLKRRIAADLVEFFGEDVVRRLLDGVKPGWESDLRMSRERHLTPLRLPRHSSNSTDAPHHRLYCQGPVTLRRANLFVASGDGNV